MRGKSCQPIRGKQLLKPAASFSKCCRIQAVRRGEAFVDKREWDFGCIIDYLRLDATTGNVYYHRGTRYDQRLDKPLETRGWKELLILDTGLE